VNFDEEKEQQLHNKKKELENKLRDLRKQLDSLPANLHFAYSVPDKFDKSKVKGFLGQLFHIKEHSKYKTAMEVTLGGRLFNVVVDSSETATYLLEQGRLQKRVTFIPLDKISQNVLPKEVVKEAQRVAAENEIQLALALVEYDKDLKPAINYAFGNTFICNDSSTAKAVAFNPSIRQRVVNLQGDVFDPSGTLTGGYRPIDSILDKLELLSSLNIQLSQIEKELEGVNKELAQLASISENYKQLKQQYEEQQHHVSLLSQKLLQSKHGQLMEKIKQLETEIEQEENNLSQLQEKEKKANDEAKRLEIEMGKTNSNREADVKELAAKRKKDEKRSPIYEKRSYARSTAETIRT